jgi:steroid 5-alpha reductase family enzyme
MTHLVSNDFFQSAFSKYGVDFQNLVSTWITLLLIIATLSFLVSEITCNYSQVDKLWSLMPAAYGWITAATVHSPRLMVMASIITIWGLRLTYNFYRKGGYSIIPWKGEEDYRWKIMRETSILKGRFRFGIFNLLFISLFQNIVIFLFCSPILLAALHPEKQLTIVDFIAGILMGTFITTESIADNQLFKFHQEKKYPEKEENQYKESLKKGFLAEGLWRYARHPNFTSEQALWICFYLFGVTASGQLINLTLAGPVFLVLIFIGSSRLTENISSKKYPEYAVYQKEVPKFIPRLFRNNLKKRHESDSVFRH